MLTRGEKSVLDPQYPIVACVEEVGMENRREKQTHI
jgi:hypothetical protein